MGGEQDESKKLDVVLETETETESKTIHISTSPPEPKSSPVAAPPPEKATPPCDDAGLQIVVTEKRIALIKAWEENEKTRADNKAYTKMSAIGAWENTQRAAIEANLKQIEQDIEIEKAKQREKMKNKIAAVHKEAEEKRVAILAKKGQDMIRVEEAAAKYHATATLPTRLFKCFGY
ncbi:remorin-like [Bidens hawaiensis]|uniref:remorin-like n=1 Tax=Bidens hawaiensis TaxID=980011 RepID=UPI004048FBFE